MVVPLQIDGNQTAWTNMPAETTLFLGNAAKVYKIDLSRFSQCCLRFVKLGVAAPTGARLVLKYHTSFTTTASTYSDIGTVAVSGLCDGTNTFIDSGWTDLVSEAKAEVYVTLVGIGGNGTLDPVFGSIYAVFR